MQAIKRRKQWISLLKSLSHRNQRRPGSLRAVETQVLETRIVLAAPNPMDLLSSLMIYGARIDGEAAGDGLGDSISGCGDINGDGQEDFATSARFADPGGKANAGETYVFLSRTLYPATVTGLNGANGFRIPGIDAEDFSGWSVAGAGDINGDRFADLVIGAYYADPSGAEKAGEAYVIFGRGDAFPSVLNPASMTASQGFRIDGIDADDNAGISVSSAGDFNADGFADLLIGAPGGDANNLNDAGESYLVFGKAESFGTSFSLNSVNGSNGIRFEGAAAGDRSGQSVASAGDVNGDGYDDVLIGAADADPSSLTQAGSAWLVFGGSGPFGASISLASVDGNIGVRFNGLASGDLLGASLSSIGDYNGDGFDDIVLGSPTSDPSGLIDAGSASVVFGMSSTWPASFDLSALNGVNGFHVTGTIAGNQIAGEVAAAGDMNGDGFDDILIGSRFADPLSRSNAGEAYVIFGRATTPSSSFGLNALNGTTGFRILGARENDATGASVSGRVDLNGDGFDDILLGCAELTSNFAGTGAATLINGRNFTGGPETQWAGAFGLTTLTATQGAGRDVLIGGSANETLNSDGGSDVLRGGSGQDILTIPDADFSGTRRLIGGTGDDTLKLSGTNISLDLTLIPDNRIEDIEIIDLTGAGTNELTLSPREVLNLSRTSNSLLVNRDAGDVVQRGSGWSQLPDQVWQGATYEVYEAGAAILRVLKPGTPVAGQLDLSSLNGTNGFRINGVDAADWSGFAVSGVGDINGDGFMDLIIGAPRAESSATDRREGHSYVVFGRQSGFGATFELSSLDGTNGFRIEGIDGSDESGAAVNRAGDVNGDGVDDLIIGAPNAGPAGGALGGQAWVVFGRRTAFPASMALSSLDGTFGFVINGKDSGDATGYSVSAAGDINGDGFDDVVLGATGGENSGAATDDGQTYVVFGRASFGSSLNVASLSGTDGFRIDGVVGDRFRSGWSVSSAGDFNGDGFADVLIGTPFANSGIGALTGESYVVFGKASGFASTISLAALNGTNGVRIQSNPYPDFFGYSVSSAGDFNGDGFDDLVIGASSRTPAFGEGSSGTVFVLAGRSGIMPSLIRLREQEPSQLLRIDGANVRAETGYSVSGGSDINGDGFSDLVIGARGLFLPATGVVGQTHVVFGRATMPNTPFSLAAVDGVNGYTMTGLSSLDHIGEAVGSIGDFNGDGFDDFIIGMKDSSPGGRAQAGSSFVVFGAKTSSGAGTQVGTLTSNTLSANRGADQPDILIGGGGNDILTSDGGLDVLQGDSGDDTLRIRSGDFRRIEGGAGFDVLQINTAGLHLNLPAIPNNRLTGIEEIDLRGFGANTLTVTPLEVRSITGSTSNSSAANVLRVRRQSDDIVNIGTGWVQQPNLVQSGLTWQVFKAGSAVLQIEILTFTSPSTRTSALRPTFTWTTIPGVTSYEIWINNDSAGVAPFIQTTVTGSSYTPSVDFPIGVYRGWLRVPAGAWTPAFSFQIATSVVPQSMSRVQLTPRPTVRWNPLPGAVSYDFWLDNTSLQQSQVVRTTVNGTSWEPASDLSMGLWRAWVRGIDAKGNFAGWSSVIEFQVLPGATLVSPGAPTFDRRPVFQWNPVSGAVSYEVYVRNQNTGVMVANGVSTSSTSWTPATDLDVASHRWWVIAVSSVATGSLKSGGATAREFFVGGRTTILTPVGSSTDTTPDFSWLSVTGASSYKLFVQRLGSTPVTVINQTITTTSHTPTTPLVAGSYRSWIQAIRINGELSPWSVPVDFTIVTNLEPTFDLIDSIFTESPRWRDEPTAANVSTAIAVQHQASDRSREDSRSSEFNVSKQPHEVCQHGNARAKSPCVLSAGAPQS